MKKYISLGIALAVILGAIYWAYSSTIKRSYEGSDITFAVGSGSVLVNNTGDSAIPVTMRADGRTANFRVASNDFDLTATSSRQGSGRSVHHSVQFDLPPGEATIDVTRGSNVQFIADSSTRITAVVTPKTADEAQTTYLIAAVIVLAALFYASHTTEHQWIGIVRTKLPIGNVQLKNA